MFDFDVAVIGAGAVGLATAHALATSGRSVLILEKHAKFGQETSSRNSEIIHAGIYYTQDSLKARLCVEGADLLYRFCLENDVSHAQIGKLLVATSHAEIPILESLKTRAANNGAGDLELLSAGEVGELEPAVNAVAALHSPRTGIVDSHQFMRRLLINAEKSGATLASNSKVGSILSQRPGYTIRLENDDFEFSTRAVVNAAGLYADQIAALVGLDVDALGYRLVFAKGSYFSYGAASPVKRLIYPVPHHDLAGLGVHATLDLAGRLRFGPDVEFLTQQSEGSHFVQDFDCTVSPSKGDVFFESAQRIIRDLRREAFRADFAGIRPKLKPLPGTQGPRDFVIQHEASRGLKGFINLLGIESPGLTASLAIAREVAALIESLF